MLANRLIAFEAALTHPDADISTYPVCEKLCEKLRQPLSRLIGVAGYNSLLTRSLTLARREAPALGEVQIRQDGSLHGLEGEADKACPILIAYILNLLTIFVGEALTIRLLQDLWPGISSSAPSSTGEKP